MQPSLGEFIRHLRRERSLTQTDLGGKHYSKSYVSALERGSIMPSRDALHFFAEQLAQPLELFERLLHQGQEKRVLHSLSREQHDGNYVQEAQQEMTALFNLIMAGTNPSAISLAREMIIQAGEPRDASPLTRQARIAFLQGLIAQERGDLSVALPCFEYALALIPEYQQAAILDALGTNYYLDHIYAQAIYYHQRALQALQQIALADPASDLFLLVELHCGHDYRALAQHDCARDHYEYARQYLRPTHHLLLAAQLYLDLGYCTYAALHQPQIDLETARQLPEEYEKAYQQAIGFLVQSRVLYQASHDTIGVARARLIQAMILLDSSMWQRKIALEKAQTNAIPPVFTSAAVLQDVEEQCRQVLIEWQENSSAVSVPTKEVESLLYSALAYLIRFHVQTAELARLGSYESTMRLELARGVELGQMVINTFDEATFPWSLIHQVLSSSGSVTFSTSPALPRLPETATTRDPLSQAEVYWAIGHVAEEMGRSASSPSFASGCYKQADRCLQMALSLQRQALADPDMDMSYLTRDYQRYINYLQERMEVFPESKEEAYPVLLTLLNELLALAQHRMRPANE